MSKEEFLKKVHDVLANGNELKKVKVKFQNGEVIKFDFEKEEIEEEVEVEGGEEENEDEDDEEEDEVEEEEEKNCSDPCSHNCKRNSQVSQPAGQKVNVINRP